MRASDRLAVDGLAPPVGYSGWWVVLGVAVLVLVLAWYGWVFRHTRTRRVRVRAADVDDARRRHLARIDEVAAGVRAGSVSPRAAHQQLASIVRSYASDTGHPVSAATLDELTRSGPAEVATLVRAYYPSEFASDTSGDAQAAAAAAHRLVSTWR